MRNTMEFKVRGARLVADIASQADVTPATVRYYTRVGLLSPNREPANGYRYFSSNDLRRVIFIRKAQALGLTIADIKAIFESVDRGEIPCDLVKSSVEQRLEFVRERIAELEATKSRIDRALKRWSDPTDDNQALSDSSDICPLIEGLDLDLLGRMAAGGNGARYTLAKRGAGAK